MNKRMVEKRMRVYLDNQHSVVKANKIFTIAVIVIVYI